MTDPSGLWVYAIAERALAPEGLAGVGGRPVRTVSAVGLVAVVSDVSMDEFGEAALRASLEDLAWLEATAMAHHRVIGDLASDCPVVPMRLATVFTSDAGLQSMLTERRDDLHEVLARIGQCREWGVKVFAAPPDGAPAAPGGAEPGVPAAAGSGAAYLQRRRTQLAAGKQARYEAARMAEDIHAELSGLGLDSRLHPPQVPQLAGTAAPMLLNGAYLLDQASERLFAQAVSQLAQQHPAVQVQLTGPWPPYSFASLDATQDDPW